MSALSPRGVGVGAGEDPQEQHPRGWTGQSGEGMGQSTGPAGVQTQGSQPSGLGIHGDMPVCLLSWGTGGRRGSRQQGEMVWSAECRSGSAALWGRSRGQGRHGERLVRTGCGALAGQGRGEVCGPASRDASAGTELDPSPVPSQPLGCTV